MDQITKEAEALIPTDWGTFRMIAYKSKISEYTPDFALVHPDLNKEDIVTVRIHSECITGDLFHSQRCDCGNQLKEAMLRIENDKGILIYLRQEGRGIGIINKLHAYNKQDEGFDTVEANEVLGFKSDYRSYKKALHILENLGINKIRLLTNNPDKLGAFDDSKIKILNRIPLEIASNVNNEKYLKTKKESLGHLLKG
ncbi:MAG: GTP cyclohydrolase II [Saprospiraceae bacterium]|nr:GTP cyclohydrolase II [Saprospiraceae bacterium]